MGILDGEVMQAKFLLYLPEQFLAWLVQTDPDEAVFLLENLTDVFDFDVGYPLTTGVGGTVYHFPHGMSSFRLYRSPSRFSDAFPSFFPFLTAPGLLKGPPHMRVVQHRRSQSRSMSKIAF
ncbi:MAG: hypothetical protein L0312_31720 [Acidobacteria bacterium]|nr:hypothetical protein [Acidobacteriota bacterium]